MDEAAEDHHSPHTQGSSCVVETSLRADEQRSVLEDGHGLAEVSGPNHFDSVELVRTLKLHDAMRLLELPGYSEVAVQRPLLVRRRRLDVRLDQDEVPTVLLSSHDLVRSQVDFARDRPEVRVPMPPAAG